MSKNNTSKTAFNPVILRGLKAKHFQLTINEISNWETIRTYLYSRKTLTYLIACLEEAPTTGHKHIHVYIQFSSSILLKPNKLCNCHIERCKGTPQQNYNYIIKDGKILEEWGKLRKHGGKSIEEVKKMTKDERDMLPLHYYNIIQKINLEEEKMNINETYKDVTVIYIFGESGSGKSLTASKIIKNYCNIYNLSGEYDAVKFNNGFWLGTHKGSKIALYDDFRPSDMKANEFINFIDYNKHILNIKGGNLINEYELIIITSIINPCDIYQNMKEEEKMQWIRRLKIYHAYNLKIKKLDNDLIGI